MAQSTKADDADVRGRSPSKVYRRASAPALVSMQTGPPVVATQKVRFVGGEDSVQFALTGAEPRPRSPSVPQSPSVAALSTDPWGADPKPNPESRRKSPTKRVISPVKGAPAASPQVSLRSPTAHTREVFWSGDGFEASSQRRASESPSKHRYTRSPSPSQEQLASSTSRPILPGHSHCSSHQERPLINAQPAHRVAKMWTSEGTTKAMKMPSQPCPQSPQRGSGCSPLSPTATQEVVVEPVLLTPRSRPVGRSFKDEDPKASSPQIVGRMQPISVAGTPVENDTSGVLAAGGCKSPHSEKPPPSLRVDRTTKPRLTQIHASSPVSTQRAASPLKGASSAADIEPVLLTPSCGRSLKEEDPKASTPQIVRLVLPCPLTGTLVGTDAGGGALAAGGCKSPQSEKPPPSLRIDRTTKPRLSQLHAPGAASPVKSASCADVRGEQSPKPMCRSPKASVRSPVKTSPSTRSALLQKR